jgi:hypothetical protein
MIKEFGIKALMYIAAFLVITILCAYISKITGWDMRFLDGWFCCTAYYAVRDWDMSPKIPPALLED